MYRRSCAATAEVRRRSGGSGATAAYAVADASRREQLGELAEKKIAVNLETDGKKKFTDVDRLADRRAVRL